MRFRTDEDIVPDDVVALLGEGRFADALVPAALQAGSAGIQPRSLTFLAEVVRRGGAAWAAGLPEPMPDQNQTHLVRPWLLAITDAAPSLPATDQRLARWLDGVAVLIEVRRGPVAFS
jgi:hypothetical protein